jgi:hypothetical protein
MSGHRIIQTIQSPFPAHNVWRRNEPVASDTIFSEVAAMHQWPNDGPDFVGRTSLVIDIYGMSSEKQFVNTLEDVIRKGERWTSSLPTALVSNHTSLQRRVEISKRWRNLRALCIDDWQSEPNYQHQNFAEHR